MDEEWWEKNDEEYQQMLFDMSIDEGGNWCIGDDGEHMDTDQVVQMVGQFLRKFRPKDHVIINVAYTCSRPRPDEFGGFAVLVTAKADIWFDPQTMAKQYADHGSCLPRVFDQRDNIQRLEDACS